VEKFNFDNKEVTPEWLTSILEKNGFLYKGRVISIEQKIAFPLIISDIFSLKINYSPESSGHLPSKILMKLNKPQFSDMGIKEAIFYGSVMKSNISLPLLTCYGIEKSHEYKQCCILFEDLTDTHYQIELNVLPTQEQYKMAIWGPRGRPLYIDI